MFRICSENLRDCLLEQTHRKSGNVNQVSHLSVHIWMSGHFPRSQPESGYVRNASDGRCRIPKVSWSWGAARTCSPCLSILPRGPQTRGGKPLLQWLRYCIKITRSGTSLDSDSMCIFGQATSLPCTSLLLPCIHLFYLPSDLPVLVIFSMIQTEC